MNTPRILFAGTPEFARASLQGLVAGGMAPVAVLTQPDRPAGRGKKLARSPVKQYAIEHGIDVLQPQKLRDAGVVEQLAGYAADLMVVVAYGLLLPQEVLDLPRLGCLNVHASLLPRWRGAAPIQAAILAGDKQTGISLMAMTAGLDSGPVYACQSIAIGAEQTAGELHDVLARTGAELLLQQLPAILAGRLQAVAQDEAGASYAGKVVPQHAELGWHEPASLLARKVRAYNPVPGAWFMLGGERIKCWQARALTRHRDTLAPGALDLSNGVVIGCGTGALELLQLQRPGKRPVSAAEFAAQTNPGGQTLLPDTTP
ncbi:MAG TPA: methionyl-tRNA formyltransferase [Woeseiaceae bacterium]|nr:methionyl-tRNA formyltransferase [Woeseiaceae bacterium]